MLLTWGRCGAQSKRIHCCALSIDIVRTCCLRVWPLQFVLPRRITTIVEIIILIVSARAIWLLTYLVWILTNSGRFPWHWNEQRTLLRKVSVIALAWVFSTIFREHFKVLYRILLAFSSFNSLRFTLLIWKEDFNLSSRILGVLSSFCRLNSSNFWICVKNGHYLGRSKGPHK